MVRAGVTLTDVTYTVTATFTQMVSAYKDGLSKQFVTVVINMTNDTEKYTIDLGSSFHPEVH